MLAEGMPQGGAASTLAALRVRVGPSPAQDATRVVVAAACNHAVSASLLWTQGDSCGHSRAAALRRAHVVALLRAMVVDGGATAGEVHRWGGAG